MTDNGLERLGNIIPDKTKNGLFNYDKPLNVLSTNGLTESDSYFVSDSSEVFKVSTKTGMYVKANSIHPLKVASSDGIILNTQVKDLKIGDYVRVEFNNHLFGKTSYSPDFAYMLGGYTAEGWFSKQTRGDEKVPTGITVSNTSDEFREVFLRNGFSVVNSNKNRLSANTKAIYQPFIDAGVNPYHVCDEKRIPESIMTGTKDTVVNYLRGLYDGDGSATDRGVTLTSTSFELISQTKLLLNNLGIVTNITKKSGEDILANEKRTQRLLPQGKVMQSARDSYNLIIRLSDSGLFKEHINFSIKYKQDRLNKLITSRSQDNIKKYQIPASVILPMVLKANEVITGETFRNHGLRIDKVKSETQEYVNVNWLTKFKEISLSLGYEFSFNENLLLTELLTETVYWDSITSIESIGEHVTYDLRVPATRHFYQNGIMGHNTGGAMIITSTPNGDSNLFAREWFKAISKSEEELKADPQAFMPLHVKWNQPPGRDDAFKKQFIDKLGDRKWRQEFECVAGDTLVIVKDIITGVISQIRIEDINDENNYDVFTENGFQSFFTVTSKTVDEYLNISFSDGTYIKCTLSHRFKSNNEFKEARDLIIGDIMSPSNISVVDIIHIQDTIKVFDLVDVAGGNHYLTNGVTSHNCEFLSSDLTLFDSQLVSNAETEYDRRVERLTMYDRDKDQPGYTPSYPFPFGTNKLWKSIDKNKSYIVGVDPATGTGEDYTVFQVFEFPSLFQVMEFRSNTMSSAVAYTQLKNLLNFLENYTKDVYFSIENNGVGNGMISLYESDDSPPKWSTMISEKGAKSIGMKTTNFSKTLAALKFKELFERGNMILNSKSLLHEMKNYVRKDGSYGANIGVNDDCIAAVLMVIRIIEEMATYNDEAYIKMYNVDAKIELEGRWGYNENDIKRFQSDDSISSDDDTSPMPFLI